VELSPYLGVGDVIPALVAGNTVLSKADSQTPLTLLWARDLLQHAVDEPAAFTADAHGTVASIYVAEVLKDDDHDSKDVMPAGLEP
jgi:acyl-CoA reductase-like NAD-dependent aldehyde dehydrogenase